MTQIHNQSSVWKAKLYRNSVNNVTIMVFQFNNEISSHIYKNRPWEQFSGAFYCFDGTIKYEVIIITVSYLFSFWQEQVQQNLFLSDRVDKTFSLFCVQSVYLEVGFPEQQFLPHVVKEVKRISFVTEY